MAPGQKSSVKHGPGHCFRPGALGSQVNAEKPRYGGGNEDRPVPLTLREKNNTSI